MTTAASEIIWSKSKTAALRECRRKFHFLQTASDSPLKKLKNRHLWTGSFIHQTIGDLLKLIRQGSPLPSPAELIEAAKLKMREEFRLSKAGEGPRLFEHEYDLRLHPQIWRSHWDSVERSLHWFFSSKWLARLKELPPEAWKAVDELVSFDVDGIKAYVKIDCAVETGGRFVIIDWKNSTLKTDDEFSLLLAALYAHEVWGADPNETEAFAVSLQNGQQLKAALNEESLMETFLRIQEESALLQEEAERQSGLDLEKIPMTSDLQLCDRCNFRKLCYAV